ncbi:osmoprotectant NAGGN system M42 family peptidase [Granulicoccus phenolivorans]|uniref:osmoprotectant NAGGN system M42 family peptidase n=1 Tax=Granulicoccus phenolivorans TaxID=266854 RepID=UPI00041E85E7|nr:osmoprotectant NAGGN system M42 family peptidase [Granulicoccus phenolivorans]
MSSTPIKPEVDRRWLVDVLLQLVQTPSPSGRTDAVMQLIGDLLTEMGVQTQLTRRGALIVDLPGRSETVDRALVVHADTLGCMVSRIKDNGRLSVIPVGTWSARFAEGARVRIFTEDPKPAVFTGTILPLKASGHAFNDEIDTQPVSWDNVEVRVDARVGDAQGLHDLGFQIGDTVAVMANPEVTPEGFIVSRHLDGKAGVAAALSVVKTIQDLKIELPYRTRLMVTIAEEVGHGATHGLEGVSEMISVDNAVCAPGQNSIEHGVTIPMADQVGPFEYHLTRKLLRLADEHEIACVRDTFPYYRSDVAAAIEAGAESRAALVAFGLDASHGWERTEIDSVAAVVELLTLWLQTPLTFAKWDETEVGDLKEFPSQHQPAPVEEATWAEEPPQLYTRVMGRETEPAEDAPEH